MAKADNIKEIKGRLPLFWGSRPFFVPAAGHTWRKDMATYNYSNEYPGPGDIARVECPVTRQNAQQAFDFLMGVKAIGLLLANQDESGKEIDISRLKDLGKLIFFLADQLSNVLGELSVAIDGDEPTSGQHKPELVSSSKKQDAGGAA